tara:strand:+ start:78 stop:620 length:543 start_codon:yes stop_codon:yes gene_type:complete
MRTCTTCGLEKTSEGFHIDRSTHDGLQNKCKLCRKAMNKVYKDSHKEEISVKKKEFYLENKERITASYKLWAQNNPDKVRARKRRRRAMKKDLNENYTAADEAYTLRLFDHACFNCGCTKNLAIDHYRPLSKGNPLTLTNAIILCTSCNSSKGSKDPEQFFSEEQTMIIQEVFDMVEEQV